VHPVVVAVTPAGMLEQDVQVAKLTKYPREDEHAHIIV